MFGHVDSSYTISTSLWFNITFLFHMVTSWWSQNHFWVLVLPAAVMSGSGKDGMLLDFCTLVMHIQWFLHFVVRDLSWNRSSIWSTISSTLSQKFNWNLLPIIDIFDYSIILPSKKDAYWYGEFGVGKKDYEIINCACVARSSSFVDNATRKSDHT